MTGFLLMGTQDAVEMSCTVPGVRCMPRNQYCRVQHRDHLHQQRRLSWYVFGFFQVRKNMLVPPEAVFADHHLLGTNLLRHMTSLDLLSFRGKSQVVVPSRGYRKSQHDVHYWSESNWMLVLGKVLKKNLRKEKQPEPQQQVLEELGEAASCHVMYPWETFLGHSSPHAQKEWQHPTNGTMNLPKPNNVPNGLWILFRLQVVSSEPVVLSW